MICELDEKLNLKTCFLSYLWLDTIDFLLCICTRSSLRCNLLCRFDYLDTSYFW